MRLGQPVLPKLRVPDSLSRSGLPNSSNTPTFALLILLNLWLTFQLTSRIFCAKYIRGSLLT